MGISSHLIGYNNAASTVETKTNNQVNTARSTRRTRTPASTKSTIDPLQTSPVQIAYSQCFASNGRRDSSFATNPIKTTTD
jgi:hypothetical protein